MHAALLLVLTFGLRLRSDFPVLVAVLIDARLREPGGRPPSRSLIAERWPAPVTARIGDGGIASDSRAISWVLAVTVLWEEVELVMEISEIEEWQDEAAHRCDQPA